MAKCLLPGKAAGLKPLFQMAQVLPAPLEFLLALRNLASQGNHETEPILEIPCLRTRNELLPVEPVVVKHQPGESLDQAGLQILERQTCQQHFRRMEPGPRPLSVGEARIV